MHSIATMHDESQGEGPSEETQGPSTIYQEQGRAGKYDIEVQTSPVLIYHKSPPVNTIPFSLFNRRHHQSVSERDPSPTQTPQSPQILWP